jgi:hypothetical protein
MAPPNAQGRANQAAMACNSPVFRDEPVPTHHDQVRGQASPEETYGPRAAAGAVDW